MRTQCPLGRRRRSRSKAGTAVVAGVGICGSGVCGLPAELTPRIVDVRTLRASLRRSALGPRFPRGFSRRFRCWRLRLRLDRCPRRQGVRIGSRRKRPRHAHGLPARRVIDSQVCRICFSAGRCRLGIHRQARVEPEVGQQQQRHEQYASGAEIGTQGHGTLLPVSRLHATLAGHTRLPRSPASRVHRTKGHCSDQDPVHANASRPHKSTGGSP